MEDIVLNENTQTEQEQPLSERELTPSEYFDAVKSRKNHITDYDLTRIYDNCLELIEKYKLTGQRNSIKKCIFHLETIERERELIKLGINTFVYRDDLTYYMKKVATDYIKIIELENYEREIPDEIVEIIAKVKDKFDQLYIIFTDYTDELAKNVTSKRDKDPILFGCFKDNKSKSIIDRFYYLGDWVDEYCDLTLDKMVNETERVGKRNIAHTISTPKDIEELKEQLNQYDGSKNNLGNFLIVNPPKKQFFSKIRNALKKK